jgi:hypothetical protein
VAARWLQFTIEHWPEWVAVAVSALGYLIIDLGKQVKSMRALFKTLAFYFLLAFFVVMNLISYGLVRVAWGAKIDKLVGSTSFLAIVFLSTVGTIGLLQSLSVKMGGQKFVNVEKMLDSYRSKVLEDTAEKLAELQKRDADKLAHRLATKYLDDIPGLRAVFFQVMHWNGRSNDDIVQELQQLEETAAKLQGTSQYLIASRMAKADPVTVGAILNR